MILVAPSLPQLARLGPSWILGFCSQSALPPAHGFLGEPLAADGIGSKGNLSVALRRWLPCRRITRSLVSACRVEARQFTPVVRGSTTVWVYLMSARLIPTARTYTNAQNSALNSSSRCPSTPALALLVALAQYRSHALALLCHGMVTASGHARHGESRAS
jgi:hypothetical protein